MDVLSLGKATQVYNKIKDLDSNVVAPLAEDRFPTVDARLDWLEGQAAKAVVAGSNQLELSQGTFTNTQLVSGKIQLVSISTGKYTASGTYESPIIDLGEAWNKTDSADIQKVINTGSTDCLVEIATSTDGVTFSGYATLNPAAPSSARYVKIRATLTATPIANPLTTVQYDQSPETKVTLNNYVAATGDMKLLNNFLFTMNQISADANGQILKATIPKSQLQSIQSLIVK